MAFPRHALLLSPLPFPLHRPHYSRCDTHQSSVRSFELREEEMRISLLRSASRKVARRGGRHRPAAGAAHETQPAGAADVSHINTRALVKGFIGDDQLGEALEGDDLVIIPAGVPRKPGMPRDDLFKINAGIVKGLCTAIARHCPNWNNLELENFKDKINEVTDIMAAVYGGDHKFCWSLIKLGRWSGLRRW